VSEDQEQSDVSGLREEPGDKPVVLLGGSGMLGLALRAELEARDWPYLSPSRKEVDLASRIPGDQLMTFDPCLVINAAAFTDVAAAEEPRFQEVLFRINRSGAASIARACSKMAIPLIHVSTDYVFDGESEMPYVETDTPRPVQQYGVSKWEGEQAVLEELPDALIARTSTLYGPGPRARPHYVDAIHAQALSSDRVEVVRPPVSSPTYTPDLAAALLDLYLASASGVVHVVNSGSCSRLELAQAVVRCTGLDGVVEVAERPEPEAALSRPANSSLDVSLFTKLTGKAARPWDAALEDYLQRRVH
jgi:dTDP-4-dehydrorhamnose reductase